jgi:glycosyltransferase involved in cell wall biosynthesis
MKIAIDIRALQDKRHSGVQEYLLNLLEELLEIDRENQYILFSTGRKALKHKNTEALIKKYSNVKRKHLYFFNKALTICWRFFNWPNLNTILDNPNIIFAPNINILPRNILNKTIITFHDLSFERFPAFFSLKSRLWYKFIRTGFLAKKCISIIAVSSSTKEDIKKIYGISNRKIKVIPLGKREELKATVLRTKGNDRERLAIIKEKYKLPNKFILYLGTLEPRKNIIGIIRAYNLLRKNNKFNAYKLVLAGPKGWLFKKIFKEAKKSLYTQDIIFTGPILRNNRTYFYNLASIFIYPSFLEGFGLPPLEAMACGLPVITSNRSSLPSVVANAAVMVDPYKIGDIAWAVEEILRDKNLYEELRKRGLERAELFSWRKTAKETLILFEIIKS